MAAGSGLGALSGRKSMPRAGRRECRREGRRRVYLCELDEGTAGVVRFARWPASRAGARSDSPWLRQRNTSLEQQRVGRERCRFMNQDHVGALPVAAPGKERARTPARLRKGPSRADGRASRGRARANSGAAAAAATATATATGRAALARDDRWRGCGACTARPSVGLPKTGPRARTAANRRGVIVARCGCHAISFSADSPSPWRIGHNRICCVSPDMGPRARALAASAAPRAALPAQARPAICGGCVL